MLITDGTSSALAVDAARALERLNAWLRQSRPTDVSASTLSALGRLRTDGAMRVTDLAAREGLTQPGMTTLINRLEQSGYATREPDPEDGRAVLVTLTDAGRARIHAHEQDRATRILARIAALDADERRALEAAVPALLRLTESESDKEFP